MQFNRRGTVPSFSSQSGIIKFVEMLKCVLHSYGELVGLYSLIAFPI